MFRDYLAGVAARLERVEDEYLRERRADVADIERRVLRYLVGGGRRRVGLPGPAVVIAHDIGPSDVAMLDREKVLGVVTEVGSRTSHSAIVARGRGIPAVVGARGVIERVKTGEMSLVDGFRGEVELNPDPETVRRYQARRARLDEDQVALRGLRDQPAVTRDGHRVDLGANIELPNDVDEVLAVGADGVGLFAVAERLAPRPVIFRTMDLGGDKVASYLGTTHETNPFLGYRGIRFALHHPEVFRAQLRAIYRASAYGKVRLMFPMISSIDELRRATDLCAEVASELRGTEVPFDPEIQVGMMVETPSAVWEADLMARLAHFFSIGTNDLTQYTLAMDRDNARLSHLYEPLSPAVLRSIRHTVECGHAAGRWVGVCGEMAGDPRTAVLLVGLGVDELSMSSFDLPRVKAAIRSIDSTQARQLSEEALILPSAAAVRELLTCTLDPQLPALALGVKDNG
ncbi:MAG: phosphoenolpyruvate--protein phosphotransferase [Candidatus Eisenbacteria bacterium]|uniref:Phosphoenolpyruvate--protein phosphotransferase n=1 Tax=Eiseniibacteriota bacterium TaxID=2212470 RepID=A0A538U2N9_UNCEI|nr:MAG: phosphoenolpyruvate--protein phosphotransferase [Candidatus Eisenbacteria bacterium]